MCNSITAHFFQVPDSDKISMRIQAVRSGRVLVSVKVIAPENAVPIGHRGRFTDSVSIDIFDDLEINYVHTPVLLAPNMNYQLKTNKDKVKSLFLA